MRWLFFVLGVMVKAWKNMKKFFETNFLKKTLLRSARNFTVYDHHHICFPDCFWKFSGTISENQDHPFLKVRTLTGWIFLLFF